MSKISDVYAIGEVIGKGAFAVVHACTHLKAGHKRAVRTVVLQRSEEEVSSLMEQLLLIRSFRHKNIAQVHSVFIHHDYVCIVMDKFAGDLMDGTNAHHGKTGSISGRDIVHVIFQMSTSLRLIHSKCIVHRDIKPDNFLISTLDITDPNCRIALCDFDAICVLPSSGRLSAWLGTSLYWAPEVFRRDYGMKVDIWALGISIFGLLAGRFPFSGEIDIHTKNPKYPTTMGPSLRDLVANMLCKSEEQRFCTDDVFGHHWLTPDDDLLPAALSEDSDTS